MSFFSSGANKELDLIIDIGSDGITASLVEVAENTRPNVVFQHRDSVSFKRFRSADRLASVTLKSLDDALKTVVKEGLKKAQHAHASGKIRRVCCYLARPWYVSSTRSIRIEKNDPFTITHQTIRDVVEEEKRAYLQTLTDAKDLPNIIEKPQLLECKVMGTKVNGYLTQNPTGEQGSELDIWLYVSAADRKFLDQVEHIVAKHVHHKTIEYHTFLIAALSCVRDALHISENFLLVDVAAESTDVSIIKGGVIVETVSFLLGRNFYVQTVASSLNTLPQVALSFLKLYVQGKSEQAIGVKIDEEVKRCGTEWLQGFNKSLTSISEEFFVPRHVYLTADEDLMAIMKKQIESNIFNQLGSDEEKFSVMPLDRTLLSTMYSDATNSITPFIAIESIYTKAEKHRTVGFVTI